MLIKMYSNTHIGKVTSGKQMIPVPLLPFPNNISASLQSFSQKGEGYNYSMGLFQFLNISLFKGWNAVGCEKIRQVKNLTFFTLLTG